MPDLHVAVAETDPMLRSLYQKVVCLTDGFRFGGFADNGETLVSLLSQRTVHIVLLEITLPKFEGLEGLQKIRTRFPRVDFIVLSSEKGPDAVRGALCAGAFDYLIKPFEWERLVDALNIYRKYYFGLTNRSGPWGQRELDKLMGYRGRIASSNASVPKGFQGKMIVRVKLLLQESGCTLSAADVGRMLGISRSTARRYLELLVERGEMEVDFEMSSVGRPLKRYGVPGSGCQK
ncbi:MAG: two-component system response regulator DctR [Thermovirga sp.]